jgi:hypothetical protein
MGAAAFYCWTVQVLEEAGVWSGDHRQTCHVIDRYRFMQLLPLTVPELKSIGYQVTVSHAQALS